jgi:hypothetical protein
VLLPLLQGFPFPSTLGEVALHPPSPASLFIYSSHGKCPFPPLQWSFPPTATLQAFLLQGCWAGPATPAFSIWLVYLQFHEGLPLPPSALSMLCVFVVVVVYSVYFLFFPWVGSSVCPGGYTDLAQGCLWEYCMPLSSPGGLLLSSW